MAELDKTTATTINHFECPNCGASLSFNPATGNLICSHCKTEQIIEHKKDVRERDFTDMDKVNKWADGSVKTYRCSNCGATSTLSGTAIATKCPYCKSPVVVDDSCIDAIRPDTVLPFDTTDEQARQALFKWRRRLFWAPGAYKRNTKVEEIDGSYMPVWTFDYNTHNTYNGRVGVQRTRTVTRNGKKVTETYIHYFHVQGEFDHMFDDIVHQANDRMEFKHFEPLVPLDMDKYVQYDDDYLAGFGADNYTLDPQQARENVESDIRRWLIDMILRKHNATIDAGVGLNTTVLSKSFKYVLMPIYVTASQYKGVTYNNYVNGFTFNNKNKVSGSYPISPVKMAVAIFMAILLAGAALLAYLQIEGTIDWPWLRFLNETTALATQGFVALGDKFSPLLNCRLLHL